MARISRRQLLATGGAAGLVGALAAQTTVRAQSSPNASSWQIFRDVVIDLKTFDAMRELKPGDMMPSGPFYVGGTVWDGFSVGKDGKPAAGARRQGTYRCTGWAWDPKGGEALAIQEFAMPEGQIVLVGREGGLVCLSPVGGGTGDYRHVGGTATSTVIVMSETAFALRTVFDLFSG